MGYVLYSLYLHTYQWAAYKALMAKQDTKKYAPDLIPASHIMEVVKYNQKTGEYIGTKIMSHGDFKNMEKQKGFRYQEFQKNFSQYKDKL